MAMKWWRRPDVADYAETMKEQNAMTPVAAEGWQLVPKEPTMGMWDDFCAVHRVPFDDFMRAYAAMLAAAPKEPK